MKQYDVISGTYVEVEVDLTKRQWPSRYLVRVEGFNIFHENCCLKCNQPLTKWKGAYYGTFSDCCSLCDIEYSHFTGYCEECAKAEALRTRQTDHFICPPVISHTDNIVDQGYYCERKVYADGSIVESTADSIRTAMRG